MVVSKLLLAIATIGLALPVHAAPAPIVFDFEDGLQGWELSGSAQRVQTQVLGGEWAIFGDWLIEGGASITMEMDLTNVGSISVVQFFVDGNEDGLLFFLGIDLIENIRIGTFSTLDVVEPGNPSLRVVDVRIMEPDVVGFFWGFDSESVSLPPIVAFIDNITFHPVPEPSTLALLAFGLAALAVRDKRT